MKENKLGKMSVFEYIGYCCGEMGYTMQNTIIASYMVMYFTNAVGIAPLVIGTMTLVCRIVDAFTDVGFGMLADRTNTKLGKFRPWYLGSIIPCSIAFVLVFFVPDGIGTGSAMAVLWMYIMYILWGSVFATINYTWLNAQPAVATADPLERRNMSTWRQWGASLIGVVVSYLGIDMIIKFNIPKMMAAAGGPPMGAGGPPAGMDMAAGGPPADMAAAGGEMMGAMAASPMSFRYGYMMMGLIVGGISLVLMIIAGIACKERVKAAKDEQASVPFKTGIKVIKGNKLLWGALLMNVTMFFMATYTTGMTGYFYENYYGDPSAIGGIMAAGGIIGLVFNTLVTPILNKKLRSEKIHIIAVAGIIVAFAIIFFSPKNRILYIIGWGVFQSMIQLANAMFFRTLPDAIDWGEWKHGIYAPGVVSSFTSFVQKIGMGIASFLLTAVLALIGYDETLAVSGQLQSAATVEGIHVAYFVGPCVIVLLTFIGYFIIRSVSKSEIIQMRKDLAEKRGVEFDEKTALN